MIPLVVEAWLVVLWSNFDSFRECLNLCEKVLVVFLFELIEYLIDSLDGLCLCQDDRHGEVEECGIE